MNELQDPLPHMSIGWVLGDQRLRLDAALHACATGASKLQLAEQQFTGQQHQPPYGQQPQKKEQQQLRQHGNEGETLPAGCATWPPEDVSGPFSHKFQMQKIVCRVGQREHVVWMAL